MATAQIKQVPREVKTIVYDDMVNLAMTREEAEALLWVLDRVGGDPRRTPRGKVEAIGIALKEQKLRAISWDAEAPFGLLYFKNP